MSILLLPALLSACQQEAHEPTENTSVVGTVPATYAGQGRDRLCLDERSGRVGLISYGEGDANCSLRGTVTRNGNQLSMSPDGDQTCRFSASATGETLTIDKVGASCAYYCGPGASLSGKTFRRSDEALPATDVAGGPLC